MGNGPITVQELYNECDKLIKAGRGNDVILLSNDDEGNGYHYCWFTFTNCDEIGDDLSELDESIADAEHTVILG